MHFIDVFETLSCAHFGPTLWSPSPVFLVPPPCPFWSHPFGPTRFCFDPTCFEPALVPAIFVLWFLFRSPIWVPSIWVPPFGSHPGPPPHPEPFPPPSPPQTPPLQAPSHTRLQVHSPTPPLQYHVTVTLTYLGETLSQNG